jgi:hypothetical protein
MLTIIIRIVAFSSLQKCFLQKYEIITIPPTIREKKLVSFFLPRQIDK